MRNSGKQKKNFKSPLGPSSIKQKKNHPKDWTEITLLKKSTKYYLP